MIERSHPVLASLDILKTIEFYEEKLGFQRTWADAGYGVVVRDEIAIHFWLCTDKIFPENTSCYLQVTEVDQLYEEFKQKNVIHPNGALKDQPWGMREFSILDLDGNLLRIGQSIN